ncbi:MAG: reductive dehalogenase [Bacteroidales bacterium]|jgi:reductive dehalogenase|nr:reductive dehalogenase [Bacteroidales bacterium]
MLNQILSQQIIIDNILLIIGFIIFLVLLYAGIISIIEKEFRAARVSNILATILFIPFLMIYLYDFQLKGILSIILLSIVIISILILFLPFRPKVKGDFQKPIKNHDERDTIFSRNELIPETEKFKSYYSDKSEIKDLDNKFREKPGLLSAESTMYDHFSFASAHANLDVIEALKPIVNGSVDEKKVEIEASKISNYIKTWCKSLGAHSIGITELKDYHLYSHKGRKELYGKEIKNKHKYAIAITIEMDNDMMLTAPKGPVVMESTQQYLNIGTIALQVAHFIRKLGYASRAHIDGNYELICPLVARDAGSGEIGRMGLLMTPKLGPRVRIAVITTDIPLEINKVKDFSSAIDFCGICKKCADVCPSRSISINDRDSIDGILRWKIDAESCFTYWCTSGTDCGRCIAVCPYSHPNNTLHNFIRWGIKNSYIFRRFALYMDNLFYGKKPESRNLPSWIDFQ